MRTSLASFGVLVVGLGIVACGEASSSSQSDATGGGSPGGEGPGGAGSGGDGSGGGDATGGKASGGAATGGGGSGGATGGMGGEGASCGDETHCSDDLKQVLDCDDNVLAECNADQACGPNGCETPCEAAAHAQGSKGCEFYAVTPDTISMIIGACHVAQVTNTWSQPLTLGLEYSGSTLDATQYAYVASGNGGDISYAPLTDGKLSPGETATVFLSESGTNAPCPEGVNVAVGSDTAFHGTGKGHAFRITTDLPATVVDTFPYGAHTGAAGASLLLPTSTWDKAYVAVNAYARSTIVEEGGLSLAIVAAENDTTVKLLPGAALVGGSGIPATAAGVPSTYSLDKGDVLQFTQDAELTGSPIYADKPIAVWGGSKCMTAPTGVSACDSAHQQLAPIAALGTEYVAVVYRNRYDDKTEAPPWRLVGVADGTALTYDPATPMGAPTELDAGEVLEFRAAGPFVVKSQDAAHPFYMSAHMTGIADVGGGAEDGRGDPEFVNVVPAAQYLSSYDFYTDRTFPETNLVFVREKTAQGFRDVTLACAGNITGWQPVGSSGKYEYAHLDLMRHDFVGQNGCDNGTQSAESNGPFTVTVWGWGSAETGGCFFDNTCEGYITMAGSYAYAAGQGVTRVNSFIPAAL